MGEVGPVSGMRRLVGDLLILMAALLTADVAAVMARRLGAVALKDTYAAMLRYELGLCAALLIFALDVRFRFLSRLGIVGALVRLGLWALAAATVFFCLRIALGALPRGTEPAGHAIVLGMALEDGRPTPELHSRLDAARRWLGENPGAELILTGGNPDADGRTEADVMRDLLSARGVPDSALRLEDRARTTRENFTNTARMIDPSAPVALITSDYHMDRAARIARSAGFARIVRVSAHSDPLSLGANVMWEVTLGFDEALSALRGRL